MSAVPDQAVAVEIDDDRKLEELGYVPSFKREFFNLATASHLSKGFLLPISDETRRNPSKPVQISFAFSILVFPSD